MSIDLYNKLYLDCYNYLEKTINESSKELIIITHHMPSYDLITPKYKKNMYNQCFASDCSKLFNNKIKLWIYGHTHDPNDAIINNIRFVCNPYGYPSENINICNDKIVTIN
jgi:hypothetical protein